MYVRIGYAKKKKYAESECEYIIYITFITFALAQNSFFPQLLFVLISPCVDISIILPLLLTRVEKRMLALTCIVKIE